MKCIIVDDEPLAREAVEILIRRNDSLILKKTFNNSESALAYMEENTIDLIFLDIQMPHINGLEFARKLPYNVLIIFTTAYTEFALDSYEVEAIDYLIKPIKFERFQKAIEKAYTYRSLLITAEKEKIEEVATDFIIVKSERKYYKVQLSDILYIEGLKDYVIIHLPENRIITKMNLKAIHEKLPRNLFLRINKSFIVNMQHIHSFDNNDVFINEHIIAIGNAYRNTFFELFLQKKI